MNTQTFLLPDLGEGLTEAVLVNWAVAVGDKIELDQVIAEVETAKSIVELPSPYAGTVLALHCEEGGAILTGNPVIEVASDSDSDSASGLNSDPSTGDNTSAQALYRSEEQAGSGNVLIGYGTGASPTRGKRRRHSGTSTATPQCPTSAGTIAVRSPIVRRLARELGIDPRTIAATGRDGAVTRADVLRAAHANSAGASTPLTRPICGKAKNTGPLQEVRREPFSPLRKAVSATLTRSRSDIPEATVWVDVDMTQLWELRPEMATQDAKAPSITALLTRYVLLALEQFPLLAARIDHGNEIVEFDGVNLGVAVDTARGLMVPMIPRADDLTVAELDIALRQLAANARDGSTPPELMRDSTFTLNNYGGLGADGSAAIINFPNVAILGIGRIMERPWVVKGEIVPRRIAQLSLVFDHRVCDGGYAAGFLRTVTALLEHPLTAYSRV